MDKTTYNIRGGYNARLFIFLITALVFLPFILNGQTNVQNDYDLYHSDDSTKIIPWRAIAASAVCIGGITYMSGEFERIWGESSSKEWLWKTNDWNGDGLAQSDEISHFMTGHRLFQLFRGMSRWVGFDNKTSNIVAFSSAEAIMIWVEIVDAYNPDQGFGVTDLITDTAGVLFELLRLKYPFARRFDLKAQYISFDEIPDNIVMATTFSGYDNAIYWLTFQPSRKHFFNIGLGYSTTRREDNKKEPIRELYAGVGFTGKDIISLFDKKAARTVGGFLDWYEFAFYVKIYEGKPIKQDSH